MKRAFAVVIMGMLSIGRAWAGSGPAKLSCEAKPGEKSTVSLKGLVPDSEETLEITLSDGSSSIRMTNEDPDAYRRKQVYGEVSLYAIPKTVKARKGPHSTHAAFEAVMRAPNPQHQGAVRSAADMLPKLRMSCTYDYEI